MTHDQAPQLSDDIDGLTGEHAQRSAYTVQTASTSYTQRHEGGEHRGGYGSKPAARFESLDTALQIDTEAAHWLRILELPDTGDTAALVRRLYDAVMAFDPAPVDLTAVRVRDDVVKDLWRWWRQARIRHRLGHPCIEAGQ